jgi:imidazole glycerol phosphate synthase subunit HisF
VLEELDRWEVDEIVVLDISRRGQIDPQVLAAISDARIRTPLVYGGGVRRQADIFDLLEVGCERFVLESLLLDSPSTVKSLGRVFGSQALIGSVPLARSQVSKSLELYSGHAPSLIRRSFQSIPEVIEQSGVSEILLTDAQNEGYPGNFCLTEDLADLQGIFDTGKGVIWFGGISPTQANDLLEQSQTVAVGLSRMLFETELAYEKVRHSLQEANGDMKLRRNSLTAIHCEGEVD